MRATRQNSIEQGGEKQASGRIERRASVTRGRKPLCVLGREGREGQMRGGAELWWSSACAIAEGSRPASSARRCLNGKADTEACLRQRGARPFQATCPKLGEAQHQPRSSQSRQRPLSHPPISDKKRLRVLLSHSTSHGPPLTFGRHAPSLVLLIHPPSVCAPSSSTLVACPLSWTRLNLTPPLPP